MKLKVNCKLGEVVFYKVPKKYKHFRWLSMTVHPMNWNNQQIYKTTRNKNSNSLNLLTTKTNQFTRNFHERKIIQNFTTLLFIYFWSGYFWLTSSLDSNSIIGLLTNNIRISKILEWFRKIWIWWKRSNYIVSRVLLITLNLVITHY